MTPLLADVIGLVGSALFIAAFGYANVAKELKKVWFNLANLVGAILLLAVPAVIAASSDTLVTPAAHALGRIATSVSIGGVTLAVLHLAGTDTMTFLAYEDTLDSGIEGAAAGADVLLRLHAATLTVFVLTLFVALPVAEALAAAMDRDWSWRFWLPAVTSALATASANTCRRCSRPRWATSFSGWPRLQIRDWPSLLVLALSSAPSGSRSSKKHSSTSSFQGSSGSASRLALGDAGSERAKCALCC